MVVVAQVECYWKLVRDVFVNRDVVVVGSGDLCYSSSHSATARIAVIPRFWEVLSAFVPDSTGCNALKHLIIYWIPNVRIPCNSHTRCPLLPHNIFDRLFNRVCYWTNMSIADVH